MLNSCKVRYFQGMSMNSSIRQPNDIRREVHMVVSVKGDT